MKINPKDYRPNVGMMIINQNKEKPNDKTTGKKKIKTIKSDETI